MVAIPLLQHQKALHSSYLVKETKHWVDLGVQEMDGGQQPVPVAPQQLVNGANGKQGLLIEQQQHLRGELQRGRPGPLHRSLWVIGTGEQGSDLLQEK